MERRSLKSRSWVVKCHPNACCFASKRSVRDVLCLHAATATEEVVLVDGRTSSPWSSLCQPCRGDSWWRLALR
eukprot:scaffold58886_cov31-Tisochrysis_lutea.AAC.2